MFVFLVKGKRNISKKHEAKNIPFALKGVVSNVRKDDKSIISVPKKKRGGT